MALFMSLAFAEVPAVKEGFVLLTIPRFDLAVKRLSTTVWISEATIFSPALKDMICSSCIWQAGWKKGTDTRYQRKPGHLFHL